MSPKLHYGTIFQPAIPETWKECFYITLYLVACKLPSIFLANCNVKNNSNYVREIDKEHIARLIRFSLSIIVLPLREGVF